MKKTLLFTALFALATSAFCASDAISDIVLFNDIKMSYKNGYYPGTIDKISKLQKDFPDSAYLQESLMYKGISYFYIQRYEASVEALETSLSMMDDNSSDKLEALFALGRSFYYNNDYEKALERLHQTCELSLKRNNHFYYNSAVLYSGRAFYKLEKYDSSIPLFEYVVKNGTNYAVNDYNEALQKLMLAYSNCGNNEKINELFVQLEKNAVSEDLYNILCLYNADACVKLGKNKVAYDYYCQIIECGNEQLAVQALKKAYILSSEANIGVNPGEVFAKSADTFKENPELVKEFWVRLGIDEYNNKNYAKAEEYFARADSENPIISLYKAKILLDSKKDAVNAEKLLVEIQDSIKESEVENISDSYYSVLLQCKYLQKKWNEIPVVYAKIANPDSQAVYVLSSYYYNKGDYKNVDASCGELYASALCKLGAYEKACGVYRRLGIYNSDYASALFACGHYEEAYIVAQKSSDKQKEYLSGICQINLKNWELAKNHFSNYIKQMSGKAGFNTFSFFYKGYAEYSLEEYKNSYASFVRYGQEAAGKKLYLRQGYEYAAKSALQNGDLKNAAIQAENVIRVSEPGREKQNAVVFCAEVLSDSQDYDKAIATLAPYINGNDEFAAETLFLTANMYNKKGDVKQADYYFNKVYTDHPRAKYSEEALFRCGEVFYAHEDYGTALNRFTTYIYKYAEGDFSAAALFFGGDCALRLGENDRTIMLTNTMLQKYKNSIYAYGANKNLLTAYTNIENYGQALEVAKLLVKDFSKQAADDEIGKQLIQLEKLVNGVDKRIVDKQAEYEKHKGSSTKAGRIAGTQLVQLYAASSYTQKDAYNLAVELLKKQVAGDERSYAAINAEFIADYNRKENKNKEAATMYLTAAEYYRNVDDSEKAAVVLYGAVDAFIADGYEGDARETADLLKKLYPESRQAQRVDRLFN